MKRQIILDTETTGLETSKGHRLIEIGCLEMINRRLTGKKFHTYLNPEREVDPGAYAISGLSTEFLQDKPLFSKIVDDFLFFIRDAELIIHNAPFDLGFINHEMNLLSHPMGSIDPHVQVIDTLILARQLHPGQKNNLDALCRRYGIDNSHRTYHGALLDAEILAKVYLQMTAGQSSLSLEAELDSTEEDLGPLAQMGQRQSTRRRTKIRPPNVILKVVRATATECERHEARMTVLQEKMGK